MSAVSPPSARRSIEIDGVSHNAPIPAGARVGNILYSSGIMGKDPQTDQLPPDAASQARFAFQNLHTLLANGGATLSDVVRITAYVKDNAQREALNAEWLRCFPHPEDRPARHTQVADLPGGMLLQIEAVAVIRER
ncbi:RidA family protein [Variovorax sp. RCC_210]|jgi:2-iminobutanoate/2-iminopropanoate deaminase|uniref:RidA family protein n=1 Tax=Variovorax sp. RCC_210 TaxID=3239217 RepID=UPI00352441F5